MNLSQFFLILRAHIKIILLILGVTVAVALTVSLMLPKKYRATSSVVLNYKGVDPVSGMIVTAQAMPGYMPTQVAIVNSKNTALKVVDDLKLADAPGVKESFQAATQGRGDLRDWLATVLMHNLDAVASRDSSVIDITFQGSDPQFVAAIANAFADAFQRVSVELKVEPSRKASVYFTDQIKLLRDNLEAAQAKLTKYQQDNSIIGTDNRLDVEMNRLNDLSTQLVMAQGAAMEARSRRAGAAGAMAAESPDVASNPLVQTLKGNLAAADARFSEVAQRLGPGHPDYQAAKASADSLRAQLNATVAATSNTVGNNATILQKRESEIQAALNQQKLKVLALNRTRDDMNVLQRELDGAQRAYELATQRFTQTSLEGQSNQSDISILATATAPLGPSSPRLVPNMMMAILVGLILGIGAAVALELLNRRVRSADDLIGGLGIPVLGNIVRPQIRTANRRIGFGREVKAIGA
ncbi:MAG: epsF [Herbaspirillum sp.]|jgi:succinoglycan biosynthesis transport protein ExoP|nr:epsF [Herbaspirillum sp.]